MTDGLHSNGIISRLTFSLLVSKTLQGTWILGTNRILPLARVNLMCSRKKMKPATVQNSIFGRSLQKVVFSVTVFIGYVMWMGSTIKTYGFSSFLGNRINSSFVNLVLCILCSLSAGFICFLSLRNLVHSLQLNTESIFFFPSVLFVLAIQIMTMKSLITRFYAGVGVEELSFYTLPGRNT